MAEIMTRITLPGQSDFSGIAEWGRVDAEEMIGRVRSYAQSLREAAEAVERAADNAFKIDIVKGVHAQCLVQCIQDPKSKQEHL